VVVALAPRELGGARLVFGGRPPRFATAMRAFVTARGGEYLFVRESPHCARSRRSERAEQRAEQAREQCSLACHALRSSAERHRLGRGGTEAT
jgi:hypothetical protein